MQQPDEKTLKQFEKDVNLFIEATDVELLKKVLMLTKAAICENEPSPFFAPVNPVTNEWHNDRKGLPVMKIFGQPCSKWRITSPFYRLQFLLTGEITVAVLTEKHPTMCLRLDNEIFTNPANFEDGR